MGKIRVRKETCKLLLDFRYQGVRCREQTALPDSAANRKKLKTLLERIEAEITLGTFVYERYFPNSPRAKSVNVGEYTHINGAIPSFRIFAEEWLIENSVRWRQSHIDTISSTLKKHLLPAFGNSRLNAITKAQILKFRAELGKLNGRGRPNGLSSQCINHIMSPLRMILEEAADRYDFPSPYRGIRSLKVPRTDVEPFTLEEVKLIIDNVRSEFRNYYIIRFFTGMRTAEIDGLKWMYVDFERKQILIREVQVNGQIEQTKTDGSFRDIEISEPVLLALGGQHSATAHMSEYVFCTRKGTPLSHNNVTKRVWYPLLRRLGLKRRRPYQTRHTAATLWLAAGENPEWIAKQMGHSTTEMLFRVYSRYVPNLTRRDGSAFERMLVTNLKEL